MIKKISLVFFVFLITIASINGCQQQFKASPAKTNNSLLWEISKPNQPTSYLFGTMHMINKEYYDMTANLKAIIHSSDAIVMELGSMPNPIKAMMLMTNKKGTLEALFSEEEWQFILNFYQTEFDMSKSAFIRTYNNFKPFFLFQSLTQAYFDKDAQSYDLNIMSLARDNDIDLIGLETIEEQVGFFDAIPQSEMATMIIKSLKTYKTDQADFEKLQALYSAEKIDELIPLMKEQSPEFSKYEGLFLTDRNKKWIPKLDTLLTEKSCFIAVGAAHLFDKNGLISLLSDSGYSVRPIKK